MTKKKDNVEIPVSEAPEIIDEKTQEEIDKSLEAQDKADYKKLVNGLDADIRKTQDPYGDALKESNLVQTASLGSWLNNAELDRQEYKKKMEEEAKQDKQKVVLGGLTEAASAIANLIGVTAGHATPMKVTSMTSDWMKEADRRRRENDAQYKDLVQKKRQAQKDAINAQMAMKMGVAQWEQKKIETAKAEELARLKMSIEQAKDAQAMSIKAYDSETKRLSAQSKVVTDANRLAETTRHNRASEGIQAGRLAEASRHNQATEEITSNNNEDRNAETARHNRASEANQANRNAGGAMWTPPAQEGSAPAPDATSGAHTPSVAVPEEPETKTPKADTTESGTAKDKEKKKSSFDEFK